MQIQWENWLPRVMFCLFELIWIIIGHLYLCERAYEMRSMIRYGKGRYEAQDTGRQPKWLVRLLYTDVRPIRNQDFALRLNMILNIVAAPYIIHELLLGWLPAAAPVRMLLALCAVFFGACTFIAQCMSHKRDYGSAFILYKKKANGSKGESSIFELAILVLQLRIAVCYWTI